jgi:hypothetical protein
MKKVAFISAFLLVSAISCGTSAGSGEEVFKVLNGVMTAAEGHWKTITELDRDSPRFVETIHEEMGKIAEWFGKAYDAYDKHETKYMEEESGLVALAKAGKLGEQYERFKGRLLKAIVMMKACGSGAMGELVPALLKSKIKVLLDELEKLI